jgi:uncharacterized iron-regulated protein
LTRAFALCLWLACALASAAAEVSEWRAWAEEAREHHPLAGRLYDVARDTLADLEGDPALVLPDGITVLGEVHDNPAHHRLRGWLIANALRAHPERRPGIVLEHIRADQQPALDQFRALDEKCCRLTTATELLGLLKWDKSGWPPAEIFKPLFQAIVAGGLHIYPGDPPRDRVRAVARGGLAAMAAEERARLGLDSELPAPLVEALSRELVDSHCGALPPLAIGGMAVAQRYRDAHQADAALAAAARHGSAILLAGNGHVRTDRGVPWHIRRRAPEIPIVSLMILEVEDGNTAPLAYVPRAPDGRPVADLVIFTPRAARGDPCQALRKGAGSPPPAQQKKVNSP